MLAGVSSQNLKFSLIVDGNVTVLSIFEEHLKKCGCPTSGQKISVDNVIITNPGATRDTVAEALESSNIEGELLFKADIEQGASKIKSIKLLKEVLFRPFQTPIGGTDEVDSEEVNELESSVISIGDSDDRGVDGCNVVLTGFATNKEIEKILNPRINVFQVPRNGSSDCIHWDPSEQKLLLDRCSEYYSKFIANVHLILPGENPIANLSAEVMSGIVIANSMRDPMQKCVIVVANSRGLCRRKLSLMEEKHEVAKQKCKELKSEKEILEVDLPQLQQNLESLVAFNASISTVEGLNGWQTLMQQNVEELASKKKEYLQTTKEFEENSKIVERLQSWQEVVTVYHTDDLFSSSETTVITTDQSQDCKTPKAYLDMSTLVEWSPDGYLSKLKQHIDEQPQRKVLIFSTAGEDITNTLFKMSAIHLVQTYSVDSPWNMDDWKPTREVWVVKETLSKEQLQHAIYIELDSDHSNPTDRYYKVYHYEKRSQACLWARAYKTLPNSSEACKVQLINTV